MSYIISVAVLLFFVMVHARVSRKVEDRALASSLQEYELEQARVEMLLDGKEPHEVDAAIHELRESQGPDDNYLKRVV